MRTRIPGLFALGSAALGACGKTDHGDSGTSASSWQDSAPPFGTIGTPILSLTATWSDDGGLPGAGSCGDTLQIRIEDPLGVTAWDFGLVESGGWSGEDCLSGYGGTLVCHPIGIDHTLAEVADCLPGSVVAGATTLMDASKAADLTYFAADTAYCYTWGADTAYYGSLGCDAL